MDLFRKQNITFFIFETFQASGARAQGPAANGGEPEAGDQVATTFARSVHRC